MPFAKSLYCVHFQCAHLNYKLPHCRTVFESARCELRVSLLEFLCFCRYLCLEFVSHLFQYPRSSYWRLLRWNVEILSNPNNCAFSNFNRHLNKIVLVYIAPVTLCCFWMTCLNTCVDRSSISIAVSMPGINKWYIHVVCTQNRIAYFLPI